MELAESDGSERSIPSHRPSLLAKPIVDLPPTITDSRRFPAPMSFRDISALEIPSVTTETGADLDFGSSWEILLPPGGQSTTVDLPPLSELLTYNVPVPAVTSEEPKDRSLDNSLSRGVIPESTDPLGVIPNLSNKLLILVV
jgi:hypothetical protein